MALLTDNSDSVKIGKNFINFKGQFHSGRWGQILWIFLERILILFCAPEKVQFLIGKY